MKCEYTKTPSALRNGINTYNFTEIWREKKPRLFQYTYQAPVGTKTRIDYFLVPKIIRQNIQSCKIIKNTFSDHDGVLINLKLPNKQHKKTPWKLNNKLLDDPNICQDFKIYWGKFQQNKIDQDIYIDKKPRDADTCSSTIFVQHGRVWSTHIIF